MNYTHLLGKDNLTMLTDFYEITMANGFFCTGNGERTVYFDLFFRSVPDKGGVAIVAGIQQVIDYIKELEFTDEDIDYLRSKGLFNEQFLDYLRNFSFACDVWAIPEGTPVFPYEPLITVRGPAIQAQFIETMLLVLVNHQSLIATKASRIVRAAQGRPVMEFGSRRAQGCDGAIYGARASYIAGCSGTACTIVDREFGIPALGTMAHSWVQLFDTEYEAFKAYAENYPDNCTLLVDTFNVLKSGVPNAIRVFKEMREAGIPLTSYGIRLDSGDLAYMSKRARKMLDEAGFTDAIISASSDLDEYLIDSLKTQGAAINSWGVGTNLITSADNPAFGGVYKLAAVMQEDGTFLPKIKLSENSEKVTNPGNKTIYSIYEKETGKIKADLICLADENFSENEPLLLFDPVEPWKKTKLRPGEFTLRELMIPVFKNGECIYESPKVMEIREYCKKEQDTLWDETRRFVNPHKVYVDLSPRLYDIKIQLLDKLSGE